LKGLGKIELRRKCVQGKKTRQKKLRGFEKDRSKSIRQIQITHNKSQNANVL